MSATSKKVTVVLTVGVLLALYELLPHLFGLGRDEAGGFVGQVFLYGLTWAAVGLIVILAYCCFEWFTSMLRRLLRWITRKQH